MKKSKKTIIACLAISLIALSGCGTTEAISNEDLSIASINNSGEEKTLVQLIEAWEDSTGEVCELSDLYLGASRAHEGIVCDNESSFLWVFPSVHEVKLELNDRDEMEHKLRKYSTGKDPQPNLVGPNWLVSVYDVDDYWNLDKSVDDVKKDMQGKLGGICVVSSVE